jgi:hypothetical protein
MGYRLSRATVVVLCTLVIVGCSGGGSKSARNATTTTAPGPVGWTRADLRPVSQPVVVGGVFVLYVSADAGVRVVALDPASGRTVWDAPAAVSAITAGVEPALGVFGELVTFLEPTGLAGAAKLVAANGRTGAISWSSSSATFFDWPEPCPDDPTEVCITGSKPSTATFGLLRFQADTGVPRPAPTVADARNLGPDIYDPGTRNPEQLVATSGSSVAWRRPLSGIFPSGYSTDYGWTFDRIPSIGLFVGWVGGPPVTTTTTGSALDLAKNTTAGFRIATGALVWRDTGTIYACGILPCPGQNAAGSSYQPPTAGLRLRAKGTESYSASANSTPSLSPGADVVIEGFDMATGKTSWSVDAGANTALTQGTAPPQITAETIVITGPGGSPTAVDLTSGTRSAIPLTTVAWCRANTTYIGPPHAAAVGTSTTYYGAPARFPCDPSGQAVSAPPRTPTFVGPAVDGLIAWSETDKVVAAPAVH